jgi:hypothetical protein
MQCECWHHRYHMVHIIDGDDRVYCHSQSQWDDLRRIHGNSLNDKIHSFPSELYKHGMTAEEIKNAQN